MKQAEVLVIIQARYGATRLPGKVLLELAGKPLIQHTIERARAASNVDEVLLATSTNPENDPLEELCKRLGVPCFRGSEDDVLDRFVKAAEPYHPRLVVRICGDEPLLDPEIVEKAIALHDENKAEYSTTIGTVPTGLDIEVVNFDVLQRVATTATVVPHREHVTKYILDHGNEFAIQHLDFGPVAARPDIVLTVDTKGDFDFVTKIYEGLRGESRGTMQKIIGLVDADIVKRRPTILLRADATKEKGIGDVVTLLNIADELQDDFQFVVATCSGPEGLSFIKSRGYTTLELAESRMVEPVRAFCNRHCITHAIVQLMPNDAAYLESLSSFLKLLTVDFEGDVDIHADILLYWDVVPFPNTYRFNGAPLVLSGSEYVPLRREIAMKAKTAHAERLRKIVVSLGGADPHDVTLRLAKTIVQTPGLLERYEWAFTLGPAFRKEDEIASILEGKNTRVLRAPPDIHCVFSDSDLVIANGGFTAFELCALGVPFIGVSELSWERRRLDELERRGACLHLRNLDELVALLTKLEGREERMVLAEKARTVVDGKGCERIAARLRERWIP